MKGSLIVQQYSKPGKQQYLAGVRYLHDASQAESSRLTSSTERHIPVLGGGCQYSVSPPTLLKVSYTLSQRLIQYNVHL